MGSNPTHSAKFKGSEPSRENLEGSFLFCGLICGLIIVKTLENLESVMPLMLNLIGRNTEK